MSCTEYQYCICFCRLSSKQVANLVSKTPSFKSSRPTNIQTRTREDHSATASPLESPTVPDIHTRPEPSPRPINTTSMPAISQADRSEEKHRGLVPSISDGWQESDVNLRDPVKRDKPKRTLSLRTNRSSASFKDKYRLPADLPPAEMEGYLERKQELQSGGKKATIRSWKNLYTVLCGQLLCFFRDRQGILLIGVCVWNHHPLFIRSRLLYNFKVFLSAFTENSAGAPPLFLHQAVCEIASDYTKKKNVMRLILNDASEYLLEANNQEDMMEWLQKISFYAGMLGHIEK